jgi:hypothetical protein
MNIQTFEVCSKKSCEMGSIVTTTSSQDERMNRQNIPKKISDLSERVEKRHASSLEVDILNESEYNRILSLIFDDTEVTDEDRYRWLEQGFEFCDSPLFGLKQGHGGPCGILAAVQAEILAILQFDKKTSETDKKDVELAFVEALCRIIFRASNQDYIKILDCPPSKLEFRPQTYDWAVYSLTDSQAKDFVTDHIAMFQSKSGCLIFLISILLSR